MSVNGSTGTDRRRVKASIFLIACVAAGVAPHGLNGGRSVLPALTLTLLLGIYSFRTVLLGARRRQGQIEAAQPLSNLDGDTALPSVDVVVAARDEEAVIGRLVERIAQLDYPAGRLQLWVVDDGSEDRTPEVLEELKQQHSFLQLVRRSREAGGGKSGALNTVLAQLKSRWMLVLDADAQLQSDVLERLIPFAEQGAWSAVQLRKAVVNGEVNLLARAQAMEMALDAVVQQGRLDGGGIAELRGNGQLLLREAIQACGGFNEATVTDDLDLSFRLLLAGRSIGVLWDPPVQEEAVLSLPALWRQRQRWAEGGLQRFLDYWPGLVSGRVSLTGKLDLSSFFLLQYVLPVVAVADLAASLVTRTLPAFWPLSLVVLGLSGVAILQACQRTSEGPPLPEANPASVALAIVYLLHWFVVIPWVCLRMAVLPKRLVWAKTLHLGTLPESDLSTQAS